MQPFNLTTQGINFNKKYTTAQELIKAVKSFNFHEKKGFLHQWISEGIPFAFKDTPLLYESIRLWLASLLEIEAKEITLIGSARIGFSLSPPPDYGREFGDHSDLDFSIISYKLFNKCMSDFDNWAKDYKGGKVVPNNSREKYFWQQNLQEVPKQFNRGFIDPYKVPNRYPTISKINDTLWKLQEKLKATEIAPKVKNASIRIYSDWSAFSRLLKINFEHVMSKAIK